MGHIARIQDLLGQCILCANSFKGKCRHIKSRFCRAPWKAGLAESILELNAFSFPLWYSGDFCGKQPQKQKSTNVSQSELFLFNLSFCSLGRKCFAFQFCRNYIFISLRKQMPRGIRCNSLCSKHSREPEVIIAPITQFSIPGNWILIPPSNYKHSSLRDKKHSNRKISVASE